MLIIGSFYQILNNVNLKISITTKLFIINLGYGFLIKYLRMLLIIIKQLTKQIYWWFMIYDLWFMIDATSNINKYGSENTVINPEYRKKMLLNYY